MKKIDEKLIAHQLFIYLKSLHVGTIPKDTMHVHPMVPEFTILSTLHNSGDLKHQLLHNPCQTTSG
jgi:hypothetical protein